LLSGFLRIENPDFSVENGRARMPRGDAGEIATPAAPSPRSSRISVKPPPNEWPMITGGLSSALIVAS
jgi:hypothetical protein